ncbi:glutamine-hydrolyzing carbamoyl-phosphate synthase small subunit [Polynucleobacter sp. AP-Nino-20-G2]|uniref:glutamine-hydrolyzing carbamoyl-phosphate synthase small subunit n=1 Tax=Polynucleobacter sp. AP-Nino-20-G2 TaxID=2576917 RepID=UPI001BFEC2D2|nr:glutamine-hydrolyzing carbamoyl-phosphate synthase small subunit [Polynucleobacter sp. AP-Nino-20-G2]QWE17649.1 glutamine-hydrolyzing carbamoyl-phosphate synthase small subunit [Polynucleobacter sp. AP-Nino-20-G2]
MLPSFPPAVLALADGTLFPGLSIGAPGETAGEVVFNTALTGYQEIITDPSYCRQIVTLTYPHIGNVGVNGQDTESTQIHAAGLVVKDLSKRVSNFRSEESLDAYLSKAGVVGISGIDTRKLTRVLRDKGAQSGAIVAGKMGDDLETLGKKALELAKAFPGMNGLDLAKVVTAKTPYEWREAEWNLQGADGKPAYGTLNQSKPVKKVVAYDLGVKRNILRMLTERGCELTVVPAQTSAAEVLAMNPDGVFFSNGPGDPGPCDYAIAAAKEIIEKGIPTFGICLGHQIMGLAAGAKTLKMKFGHHGANHPVKDLDTGRVAITSQNHGFAVDANTLPDNIRVTHVSLFDGSLQGLAWKDKPALCFQGHPEASPGPHDIAYLFDRFVELMNVNDAAKKEGK